MGLHAKLLNKWWWGFVKGGDDKRIAAQTPTAGIEEVNNLDYFGDGNKWHLMDIYRPEGVSGKLPVIFNIHGGGWMYGDKELNKYFCLDLASRGFAVTSMSYTLFPDTTFPTPIQEIFKAINFVLENAEKYNLDTENMFVAGDSAGGHYTGLVLSILADKELQKLYNVSSEVKFKAAGLICAAFAPNDFAKIPVPIAKYYVRLFYGERNFKKHALYNSVNIRNNSVEKFPPMYINTCDGDMMRSQVMAFKKYLDDKKIPCDFDYAKQEEGGNKMQHVYNVLYPEWPESKKANDRMCALFRKQM